MRIINKKATMREILFSRFAAMMYFLIILYFLYKTLVLLPVWLTLREKSKEAEIEYEKKVMAKAERDEILKESKTELGKERYQKEFFNRLDEGERLIVLHTEESTELSKNEQPRKMFWWEEVKQDFLVWWRNLQIK